MIKMKVVVVAVAKTVTKMPKEIEFFQSNLRGMGLVITGFFLNIKQKS